VASPAADARVDAHIWVKVHMTVAGSTLAEQPACAEGRKVDKDGNEASNAFCPCSDRFPPLAVGVDVLAEWVSSSGPPACAGERMKVAKVCSETLCACK
jgi:hypothetical protein